MGSRHHGAQKCENNSLGLEKSQFQFVDFQTLKSRGPPKLDRYSGLGS